MTRLIDADALKATVMSKSNSMEDLWDTAGVLNAINNTPTVEPEITNDDLQSAMTESHHLGYELAETKFKRSQAWIPVSERLPEKFKEVIVTDIEVINTYQSRYIGNGYWECDNGPFNNRIIAWQPLPEPYKKEADNDKTN